MTKVPDETMDRSKPELRTSNPSTDFEQRYNDLLRQQAHGVDWIKWKWLARDLLIAFQERTPSETCEQLVDTLESRFERTRDSIVDLITSLSDTTQRSLLAVVLESVRSVERHALKANEGQS